MQGACLIDSGLLLQALWKRCPGLTPTYILQSVLKLRSEGQSIRLVWKYGTENSLPCPNNKDLFFNYCWGAGYGG